MSGFKIQKRQVISEFDACLFQTLAVIDLLGFLFSGTEQNLLAVLCNLLLSRGLPVGKEEVILGDPELILCHVY